MFPSFVAFRVRIYEFESKRFKEIYGNKSNSAVLKYNNHEKRIMPYTIRIKFDNKWYEIDGIKQQEILIHKDNLEKIREIILR